MDDFSVGDKIRVVRTRGERLSTNHERYEGREGVVIKVDDSDSTALVSVICRDGTQDENWFCQDGLELLRKAPDISKCTCGGPEKTVMILFQPVRVCTACKREKE